MTWPLPTHSSRRAKKETDFAANVEKRETLKGSQISDPILGVAAARETSLQMDPVVWVLRRR